MIVLATKTKIWMRLSTPFAESNLILLYPTKNIIDASTAYK